MISTNVFHAHGVNVNYIVYCPNWEISLSWLGDTIIPIDTPVSQWGYQ